MTKIGIGWRPEIARAIEQRKELDFVEIVAENHLKNTNSIKALKQLKERGTEIILHCISMSLGGSQRPSAGRLVAINHLAEELGAPLVSDHICFVRAGGLESGHLLPVPRTSEAMEVIIENIRFAKQYLSVPLALENIATLVDWTNSPLDEAEFLTTILEETDSQLLLDVANLFANSVNHNFDPLVFLKKLPLERIAYVHVAGGSFRKGTYHDTHAHAIQEPVLQLLEVLATLTTIPRVMLERDDYFPCAQVIFAELDAIKAAVEPGPSLRLSGYSDTAYHPTCSGLVKALRDDFSRMMDRVLSESTAA